MKNIMPFLFCALLMLVVVAAIAGGQQQPDKPYDIGLSAGIVAPGSIWVSMVYDNVITSTSPMVKLTADAYLIPKLAMGAYLMAASMTFARVENSDMPIPDQYRKATAYEVGASIKPCFRIGDKMVIKPALEVGYRRMSSDLEVSYIYGDSYYGYYESEASRFGNAHGLGLNGSLELILRTSSSVSPTLTLGMLSQPVGGNEDTEVTFPPIFYICGGVSF